MSASTPQPAPKPTSQPAAATLPDGFAPRLLSFDVYGTLVDTPPTNRAAFEAILAEAGRPDLDAAAFYAFWERRNVAHYREPYRAYRDICRLSLAEAYERFGVTTGREEAIERYFDAFAAMQLYPDVLPTLDVLARDHRLALVSNIDDDLLGATRLGRAFDLVCTAERARGYKPDGALFRHLLTASRLPISQILHCGQSQHTDLVGGKPLGLTIAWINRRGLDLDAGVPSPDLVLSGLAPLPALLGDDGAARVGERSRRASGRVAPSLHSSRYSSTGWSHDRSRRRELTARNFPLDAGER